MQHIVTKFGGTSVSSRHNWDHIAAITKQHVKTHRQPIIVVSALTNASNLLEKAATAAIQNQHQAIQKAIIQGYLDLAETLNVSCEVFQHEFDLLNQWLTGIALLKEATPKIRAQIMSLGELLMTRLGHAFLTQQNIRCLWVDAREILTTTPNTIPDNSNAHYLTARCEAVPNPELRQKWLLSGYTAIITQGFFAKNQAGETVLLGRGGSDTSAALIAAIIEASLCEIWTDVPGIYTANPHQQPHARLLKQLHYSEAQEIASMGAKVLHPNCVPPVKNANIPTWVRYTAMPEHSGTLISQDSDELAPPIKSIQVKHSIVLISIDALNMWQQVGFLADVFMVFKCHGFSVDLLSSSEFNITLSLDNSEKLKDRPALDALLLALNQLGHAKLIEPCSAVSLVGRNIRTVLPRLGATLEVFEAKQIYMMSLASNDLNLTFVVHESHAEKLCQQLHQLLIENSPQSFYYSKSFHEEFGKPEARELPWWQKERTALIDLAHHHSPCFVYEKQMIQKRANELKSMTAIDCLFYAIKANPNQEILKTLYEEGVGFECVSQQELLHVRSLFPSIEPTRLLFTPNFAAREEYEYALSTGCHITIDNLHPLTEWGELFRHRDVILRIDSGTGAGHHKFVSTAGDESKFGIVQNDLEKVSLLTSQHDITVIGLHSHSGSGILSIDLWQNTAEMLAKISIHFKSVRWINLGGGLGVTEKPGQQPLDLQTLNTALLTIKNQFPHLTFWLEPGRYFVSDAGVLLARVTQAKQKGRVHFIGVETGMNSLIRPALYGAYHEIHNLTRLHAEKTTIAHIVGPICESADTLGYGRLLPKTFEGDVLLIANTGAYGHCMSSHYNLRPPAEEIMIDRALDKS